MAIFKEVFSKDIVANLYSSQAFLKYFKDESGFISENGKVLHIPQAGAGGAISVNPAFVGAGLTATQRIDTDLTMTLNKYVINPIALEFSMDDYLVNYNKRESIFGESYSNLSARVGDDALYSIANGIYALTGTSAALVRTTGTAVGSALGIGATGTRNGLLAKDLLQVAAIMDKQNLPRENRYVVLEAGMYWQLLSDPDVKSAADFGNATLPEGVVNKIAGLNIIVRDKVVQFSTSGTLKDFNSGFTGATTDNIGAVAFQMNTVIKGDGPANSIEQTSAAHLGDVVSFTKHFVAARRRADNKGVVLIVQQ